VPTQEVLQSQIPSKRFKVETKLNIVLTYIYHCLPVSLWLLPMTVADSW